jgi:RimJ/RimL family protein N-acetyltransferase
VHIRPVDLTDKAEFDRWCRVLHEAGLTGRPADAPIFSEREVWVMLSNGDPTERLAAYAGFDGDTIVAIGMTANWLVSNTDKEYVYVAVPARLGRQGLGSSMLEYLVRAAARGGITTVLSDCWVPAAERETHAFRRFAEKNGFALANIEVRRELRLPVPADDLAAWVAEAAAHHLGYRIETFVDDVPDELVGSLCHVMNQLAIDAPTGDIELEAGGRTPETFRKRGQVRREMGVTMHWALATDATRQTVAYTNLAVPEAPRDLVEQGGTLVLRGHRGHRLGLAVKAANIAAVQAAHPERTRVNTQNAEVNAPMVAINEKLGFRPVELALEFQRALRVQADSTSLTVAASR